MKKTLSHQFIAILLLPILIILAFSSYTMFQMLDEQTENLKGYCSSTIENVKINIISMTTSMKKNFHYICFARRNPVLSVKCIYRYASITAAIILHLDRHGTFLYAWSCRYHSLGQELSDKYGQLYSC